MNKLSVEQFLVELRAKDIRVWLESEQLRVNGPKGALTNELRDELIRRKADLLDLLKAAKNTDSDKVPSLVPAIRDKEIPLSFDQERMWFLNQMSARGSAYNLQTSILHKAEPALINKAWDALLARHETLRTTYHLTEVGNLFQQINEPYSSQLPIIDLSGKSDTEMRQALMQYICESASQPFDLEQGPVWRAMCLKLPHGYSCFLLIIHHIASDGWSLGRLTLELKELCDAYREECEPRLPVLSVHYADYAIWQRDYLQGEVLEKQLAYWKECLAGMPPVLELPLDYPRPAVQTENGSTYRTKLTPELSVSIRALAQMHQATLYMTLLTLYKVLLSRYTGQSDIVVGTPIAGRTRPEVENLQGLFLNTLVMRTEVASELRFDELLAHVRKNTLGAYAHQDMPFEKLVAALQKERDLSRNPLFQVLFNSLIIQPADEDVKRLRLDQLIVEASNNENDAQLDLALEVQETDLDINLNFTYNTDLFQADTIKRLASHYINLVTAVVAHPRQQVYELPLLDSAELKQLTEDWNRTDQSFPDEVMPQLFEAQVNMAPDAIAIEFEDRILSYQQLNDRVNRLAHYLHRQGVGAEIRVGVLLERNLDMVVSVLAVLKAGGVYVPLDPSYPSERVRFMLEDSQATVLLTEDHLLTDLPVPKVTVVCLKREAGSIQAENDCNLITAVPQASDLAYMIYTSGSTGKPKGVQIAHGALVNFLQAMAIKPGLNQNDVLVAVTTLSFDIAVLELYLPLISGARLVLASRETAADGDALNNLLVTSRATIMQATPATWRLLLEAGWRGAPGMRILCGGEALPQELANQLLNCCAELWNLYGPTETTVWSTAYKVKPDSKVLIGRPIANTRVYILDSHLQPVPIGVTGELYIGGSGVARGYWQHPELNKERFITDPFSNEPDARMYKTGDAVRYLADGNIEYLSRIDNQLKLRGYRIELGEIESVITEHPEVSSAVAIVREDTPGDQRLVAYGIPASENIVVGIKDFLRQRLPEYMVPATVVWLGAFPLTPNGKIDRQALPAPPRVVERKPDITMEPMGHLEITMARIWEELLEIDDVQAFDTFFDLGGHSLLALKVINQFKRETGARITPADLVRQSLRQIVAGLETTNGFKASESAIYETNSFQSQDPEQRSPGFLKSIKNAIARSV